ncbi:uncharacterized protein [Aristolochia californica]|uniref:uncharacterized protein n=1 Tax=Aristolochia californica TaxID=171875 RepID=UPI0035D88D5B
MVKLQRLQQNFVNPEVVVTQKIVVQNNSQRGVHFRCAGPQEKVYIIGGHETQKVAYAIYEEIQKRRLLVVVAGIPKTIDNDIAVIEKSFGFDPAVEEAQRPINAAHVAVEIVENGVRIVKLMGRHSGFIAMSATLASRHVDCCLIPKSPFYLEGEGGVLEFVEQRIKENGHIVIELTESSGQDYVAHSMSHMDTKDASGNCLLLDVGLWLSKKVKDHFSKSQKTAINLKYIDPTYMIRVIPSTASNNIYCTLLAHSAVHGAITGYSGQVVTGMDVSASEFSYHKDKSYDLNFKEANHDSSQKISGDSLKTVYKSFVAYYPLVSIVDPFAKADWEHFNKLTKEIGEQVQSVGDHFLLTNLKWVEKTIQGKACNALLLKINHIGSVTESIEAVQRSKRAGWGVMTGHWSGRTEDPFIPDMAVDLSTGQIQTGAPCRFELLAKDDQHPPQVLWAVIRSSADLNNKIAEAVDSVYHQLSNLVLELLHCMILT